MPNIQKQKDMSELLAVIKIIFNQLAEALFFIFCNFCKPVSGQIHKTKALIDYKSVNYSGFTRRFAYLGQLGIAGKHIN